MHVRSPVRFRQLHGVGELTRRLRVSFLAPGLLKSVSIVDSICSYRGGLGDPCEGSDGPDDSLCAGNLGCQVDVTGGGDAGGEAARYVCGGAGADCSFSGNYESSSRPNHLACVSGAFASLLPPCSHHLTSPNPIAGWCNPSSLSCDTRSQSVMARVQSDQRVYRGVRGDDGAEDAAQHASRRKSIPLPNGSACPAGFSACPIPRKNSPSDYLFACFDFLSSETHCGGCHDVGAGFWQERQPGVDCTQLPGVASASCVNGQCQIGEHCMPSHASHTIGT